MANGSSLPLLRALVENHGEAKRQLFDYVEVFYDQRRRFSTLGPMCTRLSRPKDRLP